MFRKYGCVLLMAATLPMPVHGETDEPGKSWRAIAEQDLGYIKQTIQHDYIYAVRPGSMDWNSTFAGGAKAFRCRAGQVHDFASYRAVVQHFVATLDDPHFRIKHQSPVQQQVCFPTDTACPSRFFPREKSVRF